ncbi:MAG: hypothetical protein IT359_09195 [Gemmatimonadaceae bacterium]|nr:hypothetical protein [Gemmatimonadaceae bacterium]
MQRSYTAIAEPSWQAIITARRPLLYVGDGDSSLDRPRHVRAGSGLTWVGDRLAVVQDDTNFIALLPPDEWGASGDGAPARAHGIALPAGPAGRRQFDDLRGNKGDKLDLEACVTIPGANGGTVLAFGSGSRSERERVIRIDDALSSSPRVTVIDAAPLYAALRRDTAFAGSDMNIEGVMLHGGLLRLFGRGNGAPRDGDVARNSTCDVDAAALVDWLQQPGAGALPALRDTTQYHLGVLGGVALGFTDACARDNHVMFVAAAESSPDATRDGAVTGSVLGVTPRGGGAPRFAPITHRTGEPVVEKVEGIAPHPSDASRAFVVIDSDDPARPSELCELHLVGAWRA